jgi:hypothetical protein
MTLEQEFLKATKVKHQDGESRDDYLDRILDEVANLDDAAWRALSKNAQDWYNIAQDACNNDQDPPDFPDAEEGDGVVEETTDVAKVVELKKPTKPAPKPAPKVAKPAPKPAPKVAKPNGLGNSAQTLIKQTMIKKPRSTTEELAEMLTTKGVKASNLTVSTIRSDFRHSIKVLQAVGMASEIVLD